MSLTEKRKQRDLLLIELILNGTERLRKQAEAELYARHCKGLTYLVKSSSNFREDEVEDIVAKVMVKALDQDILVKFEPKYAFSAFLYRIAKNEIIDLSRKKEKEKRNISIDETMFNGDNETMTFQIPYYRTGYDELYDKEVKEKIIFFIDKLNPKQREILLYNLFEGLKYKEICDITGYQMGSVQNCIHRAKEKLKSLLIEEGITLV